MSRPDEPRCAGEKDKDKGNDKGKGGGPPQERQDRESGTSVLDRTRPPKRYRVVMHNDDYTPMEFVVMVLESIFRRSKAEATRVMLTIHTEGAGTAGVYSREVAETKAAETIRLAREGGYPLLVTTEPE